MQAQDTTEPFSDIDVEMLGNQANYAVITGCGLTYSGADLTVTVAAGSVLVNGALVAVAGAAVTLVPDATNPRWAWIGVDDTGTPQIDHGTAAADPAKPEQTDVDLVLGAVLIPGGLTIANNATAKLDKRIFTPAGTWRLIDAQVLSGAVASVSFQNLSTTYRKFRLTLDLICTAGLAPWVRFNNDTTDLCDYKISADSGAAAATAGDDKIALSAACVTLLRSQYTVVMGKPTTGALGLLHSVGSYGTAANTQTMSHATGNWRDTTELISRIDVLASTSTFAAGSRITLEGSI